MKLLFNTFTIGLIINFFLIFAFRRFQIMTKSGWISAGILGTLLWGSLGWKGWISVVIYLLLGSFVTKLGLEYKDKLGIAEKRGGRRGPENVLGSASTGLFLALMIKFNVANIILLKVGFAASFAAKLADTFGSEIGKRYGKNTFLITTFKKVRQGTEGAISLEGTIASLFGALIMSFVMFILGFITLEKGFFIVCFSGFAATIFESFIGATFQDRFNLSNEAVNVIQTSFSATLAIFLYKFIF